MTSVKSRINIGNRFVFDLVQNMRKNAHFTGNCTNFSTVKMYRKKNISTCVQSDSHANKRSDFLSEKLLGTFPL